MKHVNVYVAAGLLAALWVPAALAGPDWVERGDAGSLVSTAQQVVGINQLTTIVGNLSPGIGLAPGQGDYEDMYLIRIIEPTTFSFEVITAGFDAQLFLFNVTQPGEAFGLLANDNTPLSLNPKITSPATDQTGAMVALPGVYALAISGIGNVPVSSNGAIFNFGSPSEVSGPDGPGGLNAHTGWSGPGATGSYSIRMIGVGWYDVPAPGAAVTLLGGLGMLAGRRRR